MAKIGWQGVFPAVTTQFRDDFSLDLPATHKVIGNLVRDGVSGLIVCGTVGENTALSLAEKVQVMEAAKDAAAGRVPVIAGIAEFTTAFAKDTAREAAASAAAAVSDLDVDIDAWVTVPDACELLGIDANRVRQLINERQVLAVRREGVLRIPAAFLQAAPGGVSAVTSARSPPTRVARNSSG